MSYVNTNPGAEADRLRTDNFFADLHQQRHDERVRFAEYAAVNAGFQIWVQTRPPRPGPSLLARFGAWIERQQHS